MTISRHTPSEGVKSSAGADLRSARRGLAPQNARSKMLGKISLY